MWNNQVGDLISMYYVSIIYRLLLKHYLVPFTILSIQKSNVKPITGKMMQKRRSASNVLLSTARELL